jgi:hypothetical protein
MRVEDPLAAFCFDRAVMLFGEHAEAATQKAAEGKSGPAAEAAAWNALAPWIGAEQKFANPMAGNY